VQREGVGRRWSLKCFGVTRCHETVCYCSTPIRRETSRATRLTGSSVIKSISRAKWQPNRLIDLERFKWIYRFGKGCEKRRRAHEEEEEEEEWFTLVGE
jgi:hypothetical protein